jgi:hypothetical protein
MAGRGTNVATQRFVPRERLRRTDPLTGRQIRLRKTCKTERAAQIELGRLLEQAAPRGDVADALDLGQGTEMGRRVFYSIATLDNDARLWVCHPDPLRIST